MNKFEFFDRIEKIRVACLQLREQVYRGGRVDDEPYTLAPKHAKPRTSSYSDYEILYAELENVLELGKQSNFNISAVGEMAISNLKSEILAYTSEKFKRLANGGIDPMFTPLPTRKSPCP